MQYIATCDHRPPPRRATLVIGLVAISGLLVRLLSAADHEPARFGAQPPPAAAATAAAAAR